MLGAMIPSYPVPPLPPDILHQSWDESGVGNFRPLNRPRLQGVGVALQDLWQVL
jgi:hypothetical protein